MPELSALLARSDLVDVGPAGQAPQKLHCLVIENRRNLRFRFLADALEVTVETRGRHRNSVNRTGPATPLAAHLKV